MVDVLLWRLFVVVWFASFFYLRWTERAKRASERKRLLQELEVRGSPRARKIKIAPELTTTNKLDAPESKHASDTLLAEKESGLMKAESVDGSVCSVSTASTATLTSQSRAASTAVSHGEVVVSNISAKKSGYFELDPSVHIEIRPGMEKHMNLIAELRELVAQDVPHLVHDKWPLSDKALWRYLVARKLDLEGARKQVVATLKWRDVRRPDEIRLSDVRVELETGKMGVRGIDRHGRPVVVLDSSKENTWDQNGNMRALVYTLNRALRKVEDPVDKYVLVVRLGETSMFNFSKLPGPAQVKETAKILMTVYAERLGHAILYHPPKIFTIFLNLFRSIFDPHVLSKAVWISGDVSPGSVNDRSLTELLGPHWRELLGESQPLHDPKWTPGYNSPMEYEKMVKEEQELDHSIASAN